MNENDCVFYRGTKCSVLTRKNCEKCSFHKTEEESLIGRKKASLRLKSLPADTQIWIKEKYYIKRRREENDE